MGLFDKEIEAERKPIGIFAKERQAEADLVHGADSTTSQAPVAKQGLVSKADLGFTGRPIGRTLDAIVDTPKMLASGSTNIAKGLVDLAGTGMDIPVRMAEIGLKKTGIMSPETEAVMPSKYITTPVSKALGRVAEGTKNLYTDAQQAELEEAQKISEAHKESEASKNIVTSLKATGKDWLGSAGEKAGEFIGEVAEGARGYTKGVAAYPGSAIPLIIENIPNFVFMAGASRKALEPIAAKLEADVAAGIMTKTAADKAVKAAAERISTAVEGGVTAGQVISEITDQDPNATAEQKALGIAAGITTSIIAKGAGKITGSGNVEGKLAAKGLTGAEKGVSRWSEAVRGLVSEGLLQEPFQEGTEQMWTNVATGKPLHKDVGEGMVGGFISGGAMGASLGAISATPTAKREPVSETITRNFNTVRQANFTTAELLTLHDDPTHAC